MEPLSVQGFVDFDVTLALINVKVDHRKTSRPWPSCLCLHYASSRHLRDFSISADCYSLGRWSLPPALMEEIQRTGRLTWNKGLSKYAKEKVFAEDL